MVADFLLNAVFLTLISWVFLLCLRSMSCYPWNVFFIIKPLKAPCFIKHPDYLFCFLALSVSPFMVKLKNLAAKQTSMILLPPVGAVVRRFGSLKLSHFSDCRASAESIPRILTDVLVSWIFSMMMMKPVERIPGSSF